MAIMSSLRKDRISSFVFRSSLARRILTSLLLVVKSRLRDPQRLIPKTLLGKSILAPAITIDLSRDEDSGCKSVREWRT